VKGKNDEQGGFCDMIAPCDMRALMPQDKRTGFTWKIDR
jgi:hypothetical protein